MVWLKSVSGQPKAKEEEKELQAHNIWESCVCVYFVNVFVDMLGLVPA